MDYSLSLAEWGRRILDNVIGEDEPGRGLYFYVDQHTLAEVSEMSSGEEALTRFCRAYTLTMPPDNPIGYYYKPFEMFERLGFDSSEFYEFIGLLAMTVLAITENSASSPTNVYKRQRELLGLSGGGMPPKYDEYIQLIWKCWNSWIKKSGRVSGVPVIEKEHPYWTNIGWPKAQGIIRRKDRELIRQWIDDRDLMNRSDLDLDFVFNLFLSWLNTSGSRGARLRAMSSDTSVLEIIRGLVSDELTQRDYASRSSTFIRERARIVFDEIEEVFQIQVEEERLIRWHELCNDSTITFLEHNNISRKQLPGYAFQVIVDNPRTLLNNGLKATLNFDKIPGLSVVIVAGGQEHYLLDASNRDLVETTSPRIGGEYAILCSQNEISDSLKFAHEVAGLTPLSKALSTLAGWHLVGPFTFSQSPNNNDSWLPRPIEPISLNLIGGLKVGNAGTYLTYGLPDLQYPASDSETLSIDGNQHRISPDGGLLQLSDFDLPPGDHEISMQGTTKKFRSVQFVNLNPVISHLGHKIMMSEKGPQIDMACGEISEDRFAIQGLSAKGFAGQLPVAEFQPPHKNYFVFTSNGEVYLISSILPVWAQSIGISVAPRTLDLEALCSGLPRNSIFLIQEKNFYSVDTPRFTVRDIRESMTRFSDLPPIPLTVSPSPHKFDNFTIFDFELPDSIETERFSRLLEGVQKWNVEFRSKGLPTCSPIVQGSLGHVVDSFDTNEDQLLFWLSESPTGSVSVDRFYSAVNWINEKHPLKNQIQKDGIISRLTSLGFLEVDYSTHQVGIAKPTIAFPSNSGSLALLTGSRSSEFIQRLTNNDPTLPGIDDVYLELIVPHNGDQQTLGPTLTYLHWDPRRVESLQLLLDSLGIAVAQNTSDIIVKSWPTLDDSLGESLELTEPPAAHMYKANSESLAVSWLQIDNDEQSGLYRYQTFGQKQYAWIERKENRQVRKLVSRETGHFLHARAWQARSGSTKSLIYYSESARSLEVPFTLLIPRLLERALVANSGIASVSGRKVHPIIGQTLTFTYHNVDLVLCTAICSRLGQKIERIP